MKKTSYSNIEANDSLQVKSVNEMSKIDAQVALYTMVDTYRKLEHYAGEIGEGAGWNVKTNNGIHRVERIVTTKDEDGNWDTEVTLAVENSTWEGLFADLKGLYLPWLQDAMVEMMIAAGR